ncbi:tRNA (5-methylaminomethyl-2-thiouridine)(34)-methyltransferase MnmD [Rhizobium leguminosarum]|uniref:tRNA (5-methylaminomethyl-2-thiouridine)(34)-methyltransferase MnmD n=1 Tax=Rhizobium leguminosarum TaxID=384 RepID=UPI002E159A50|nr:tRNA (5-methylaminomethyl-2-thiouridine)(34)-methyltransferase MnmD [Rhizobium leguminosarum]WSH70945.1 tRNA (5-methylaminomethyl-2-thiouridine)(34)-methyltransferase MnmD [Rhizobium leguminosarum]
MTDVNPDQIGAGAPQPLEWRDGDMPYSTAFGDHFYCQTDGRLECGHVFLAGNGLPERWNRRQRFRIGELGFGTGLNFAETWRQWKLHRADGQHLRFTSFELHPMRGEEIGRALSHWPEIDAERQVLTAAWPEIPAGIVRLDLDAQTTLSVVCGYALDGVAAAEDDFDAWYLDGFAPSRNSDMWSEELMRLVCEKSAAGGTFATYAAAGFVRRNLIAAGFAVERRQGFAGKREMLCGIKASPSQRADQ